MSSRTVPTEPQIPRNRSSIRRRTIYIVLVTTLVLTIVMALGSAGLLLSSYVRLEDGLLREDMQALSTALQGELDQLRVTAALLARLPDEFVPDGPSSLQRMEPDDALMAQFPSGEQVGLVQVNGALWLAAWEAQPKTGIPWVVGRPLDAELLTHLEKLAGRPVALVAVAEGEAAGLGSADTLTVKIQDASHMVGLLGLSNAAGQRLGVLRLESDRNIYNQGRASIAFFALAILAAGLFFVLIISRSLERDVLSRLDELYGGIRKIREQRDFSLRLQLSGDDELTHLAGGINETLQALQTSTLALKENEERLAHEVTHDALTGFPNRLMFIQHLNQALALLEVGRSNAVGVLFVDLDGFKLINDSYDHQFGDRILIAFAERLKRSLRSDDFVARLGGDEFGVLLENLHQLDEAARVAQRILDDVRKPFDQDGYSLFLTASIGIATTRALLRSEELLRNADMAMYNAKERGKACYALFDQTMHNQAMDRLNLENDLRRAIERDEFTVYYQPIVSMFDGQITALEALIRWQHPERGLLLPDTFLYVTKEAGLMNALNRILFRKSFGQLRDWRTMGLTDLRLSLNVSARVLPEKAFWELFYAEMEAAGVPPTSIQIEVVESEMAASIDQTLDALEMLKTIGVTISVDDFGTGYSSLAYLKRLPIHSLKIDRTFIKDVINDRDDAAIVSAMIVMAHVLELDVVAEGVETESQFRFLLDQSCEKAQGYLLAHPEPPETITELLLSGRALLPESE